MTPASLCVVPALLLLAGTSVATPTQTPTQTPTPTQTQVRAQPSTPTLEQLAHTAWSNREGAPGMIVALAQGTDGVLWIGSHEGLFRYDGLAFERVERGTGGNTTAKAINALFADPDGSLWIGYLLGGVSRLRGDDLSTYREGDGLPGGTVTSLALDSSHVIWASTTRGVARRVGERWQRIDSTMGYPGGTTADVTIDRRGWVWLSGTAGVYALRRGTQRFARVAATLSDPTDAATGVVREAPDGSMWGASLGAGLVRLSDTSGRASPARAPALRDDGWFGLMIDREAQAWALGPPDRIIRVRLPTAATERGASQPLAVDSRRFTRDVGMSGSMVIVAMQDREGNVWVGSEGGLDRFRETKLTPVRFPRSVVAPVLLPQPRGAMWATSDEGSAYTIGTTVAPRAATWGRITSASRDGAGDSWIAGPKGAWRLHAGGVTPVPLPDGASGREIQAIANTGDGTLWLSVAFTGVFRRRSDEWVQVGAREQLPNEVATVIAPDMSGRTWLGYEGDRVMLVDGDSVRRFDNGSGLAVGNVIAIHPGRRWLWVGGTLGVARFDGRRFVPLTVIDGPLRTISGILERADGELWLNGADGVTRVPAAEVAKAEATPSYRVTVERFDFRDGIDGTAPLGRPTPTVVEGGDGRLWFTTMSGVTWIDPRHVRRNALLPSVRITSVKASGDAYDVHARISLPPRTTALEIGYAATSLGIPERVRYRYRLVGNDTTWQEVGGRREAIYTNLGPGEYRFQVIASNDDGIWNTSGAAVDLVIPPTFVQSNAFVVVMAGMLAAALWGAATWRQRRLAAVMKSRFDATLAERTRIAQELHDTLLQGFSSVSLRIQVAHRLLHTRPDEAERILEGTVASADEALREARDRVSEMRAPELDAMELPDALRVTLREATSPTSLDVQLTVTGKPKRLAHTVEMAALRIAREAVTNVVKHADARTVHVELAYEPRALTVRIRDDGRGMAPGAAEAARREGHWGVVGMRERAEVVGGRVEITSAPGMGTLVSITLPAILDG